jgi:hypothetical protein
MSSRAGHGDAYPEVPMLGSWTDRVPEVAKEFQDAEPFPLVVIDGFLEESAADGLLAEFPAIDQMKRSNDYIFADKRQSAQLASGGSNCQQFHDLLLSDEFAVILGELTGRNFSSTHPSTAADSIRAATAAISTRMLTSTFTLTTASGSGC